MQYLVTDSLVIATEDAQTHMSNRGSVFMNERDYTFQLSARGKARHNAGPYDEKSRTPMYEIEISIPADVRHLVDVRQFLMAPKGTTFGFGK